MSMIQQTITISQDVGDLAKATCLDLARWCWAKDSAAGRLSSRRWRVFLRIDPGVGVPSIGDMINPNNIQ